MASRPNTAALIVAAGSGSRFGGSPKQTRLLGGRPVVMHCWQAFAEHSGVDRIIVVGDATALPLPTVAEIVAGGDSRRASVRCGLEALADAAPDRVLIHDAARPLVPPRVIDDLIRALDEAPGAVPVLPVVDTLAASDGMLGAVVPRDGLVRVQTPQAFEFAAILASHRAWDEAREATDDAQMLRAAGGTVATVAGDARLEKITWAEDLARMEAHVGMIQVTGSGYDVHRLVEGADLWMGGIRIPHDRGLSGHSDADVVLHAITDALLGCIGAGDIGSHFPPSDARWRGAASAQFLQHALSLVEEAGGRAEHVDVTIICEAPKIGPHREAMRACIADLLRLPLARVSVKATTTERLGFAGREEGIAAQAVATVSLPGVL